MAVHEFTREGLWRLMWSKPMRTLASESGLSDVGLAKVYKRVNISSLESRPPAMPGRFTINPPD